LAWFVRWWSSPRQRIAVRLPVTKPPGVLAGGARFEPPRACGAEDDAHSPPAEKTCSKPGSFFLSRGGSFLASARELPRTHGLARGYGRARASAGSVKLIDGGVWSAGMGRATDCVGSSGNASAPSGTPSPSVSGLKRVPVRAAGSDPHDGREPCLAPGPATIAGSSCRRPRAASSKAKAADHVRGRRPGSPVASASRMNDPPGSRSWMGSLGS